MAEPDREIIEQFMAVTNLDEGMARYFLTQNDNDLQRAVDMYFEANLNQSVITIDGSDEEVTALSRQSRGASTEGGDADASVILLDESDIPSAEQERLETMSSPGSGPATSSQPAGEVRGLKLICWNIQGLEQRFLRERTVAAMSILDQESPDVIFLQEVVPETDQMMKAHFGGTYHVFSGHRTCQYFASILLKKDFRLQTVMIEPFPGSRMGRNLIIAKAEFHGTPMKLMTSHIESLASDSRERKSQLRTTFNHMREIDDNTISIFGADTNAKDAEISSLHGDMAGIHDVWEALGSSRETRYTWDTSLNDNLGFRGPKIRYDRIYCHQERDRLCPVELQLIGKERLSCRMFISDHWGIMVKFDLRGNTPRHKSIVK